MAITLVGSNTNTAAAANITIDLSGIAIQEGDVVYVATSGNGVDQDVTEDSGTYTELATDLFADDSSNLNFAVFRKVQTATPDTSVTINSGAANTIAGLAYVLRGVDNTTPEDATPTTLSTTTGVGTPNPPAITPVTDGAWVLPFAGSSEADAVTNPPTDYTDLVDVQGTAVNVMVSRREIATAGSPEDPGAYSDIVGTTADPVCAITVAVRPAAEETGRTGTMAATETGADDATMSGAVVVAGTLAAAEAGADTFAGSGSVDGGAVQPLTYGAGRFPKDYESRVRAHYERIEREQVEREVRLRQLQKQQAKLEERKKTESRKSALAKRRAKIAREIEELETAKQAAQEQIDALMAQIQSFIDDQSMLLDRRRRMVLLLAAAA